MNRLRAIGITAEREMLQATCGVNTHRGAIFGMGLLCAAAGYRKAFGIRKSLGRLIAERWGEAIVSVRYVFAATAPQPRDATARAAQELRQLVLSPQCMILPFPRCMPGASSLHTMTKQPAFKPA